MNQRKSLCLGIAFLILIVALAVSKPSQAQLGTDYIHTINPKNLFAITGKVAVPIALSIPLIQQMPQIQVETIEDGKTVTYSGVPLKSLLAKAGLSINSDAEANPLILTAIDQNGNSTPLSPESTKAIFKDESRVIVADKRKDKPLGDDNGPLMLIVPGEQGPAQFIRNLARIRVDTAK